MEEKEYKQIMSGRKIVYCSLSEEDTEKLGRELGIGISRIGEGVVIGLKGEIGAGKTVFVRGIVEGLGGEKSCVSSPTFVIMQVYQGNKVEIYHFDLYRLREEGELFSFGWNDIVGVCGVSIVEWADKFPDYLPENSIWVNIEHGLDGGRRRIEILFPRSSIG